MAADAPKPEVVMPAEPKPIKVQPQAEPVVPAGQPGVVPRYFAQKPGDAKPVAAQEFVYVGDHPEVNMWGVVFKRGEAAKVTDPFIIGKLSNNIAFSDGSDKDRLKEAQRLNQEDAKRKAEEDAKTKAGAERLRDRRI